MTQISVTPTMPSVEATTDSHCDTEPAHGVRRAANASVTRSSVASSRWPAGTAVTNRPSATSTAAWAGTSHRSREHLASVPLRVVMAALLPEAAR